MGNIIIYENEQGLSVELSAKKPFLLKSFEGFGSAKNIITTVKSPFQDGATKQSSTLDVRDMKISGTILTDTKRVNMEARAELLNVFNPKLQGKLIYDYGSGKREIEVEVEEAPAFSYKNSDIEQPFSIDLLALNPCWQDTEEIMVEIVTWAGGEEYPFEFPVVFATKGNPIKNVVITGNVETPIEVMFKGPAVNPRITNNITGEFIRVKKTLTADDTLIINTEFGKKKVRILNAGIYTNAFNYIDLNSIFFQLKPGDNVLQYSTDSLEPSSVVVKYRNRYIGV